MYASLATAYALKGEKHKAQLALKDARQAQKKSSTKYSKASVPLFLKLQNEDILNDCSRVEKYINQFSNKELPVCESFLDSSKLFILNLSASKKLKLKKLFGKNGNPMKLEVCSGHGDWIVEKATKFPQINWIALEIRFERCFQIWSKMKFANLENLLILV